MMGVLLIGCGAITARWTWFENGGWIRAIPTDVLIELVPHVRGEWALREINDRGNAWSQTSPTPDAEWPKERWARLVNACSRVVFDESTPAKRRVMAFAVISRAPDITPLVPGLIAGLSSEDQNMRSICLLTLNDRRHDLSEYKDAIVEAIRHMPEDSRWWMEADIPRIAEVFDRLVPLEPLDSLDETPREVADAIERGGEEALFRRYRAWGITSATFIRAYSISPAPFCVERVPVDLGPDQPSTEIVHVRDTIGLHGEAIVMQQIAGRWKSLGLIHVMNRLCPTSFFFEPLRTSHGTFLAVRTSSVPFDNVQNSTASFSDCYAAFDLRSGFPRLVAHEITSAWDRAAAIGAGGRYADTSLVTGTIRVVDRGGRELLEFPMEWTWREPPAPGAGNGTGRVLFTRRYTIRQAWDSSDSFNSVPEESDLTSSQSRDLVFGWPDDALRYLPDEFRKLARGEDWQRRWLVDYLKSCKPGELRSELEGMLADVMEKAAKERE